MYSNLRQRQRRAAQQRTRSCSRHRAFPAATRAVVLPERQVVRLHPLRFLLCTSQSGEPGRARQGGRHAGGGGELGGEKESQTKIREEKQSAVQAGEFQDSTRIELSRPSSLPRARSFRTQPQRARLRRASETSSRRAPPGSPKRTAPKCKYT